MPKKKTDSTQDLLSQAPHRIAVLIDGVIQDVITVPDRMAALLLSEPTFGYFNGATLPQDTEGRNIIGQTRFDDETNEWVHTEMDTSERREPVSNSPWDVDDDSE